MATIHDTVDNPTSADMAEQDGPGYKLVKMADVKAQGNPAANKVKSILLNACSVFLLPVLTVLNFTEICTYLWLLVWTAFDSAACPSAKLVAFGQLLDLLPDIINSMVPFIGLFHKHKSDIEGTGTYTVEGDGVPGIDLILPTCKEAIDVILDTVKACLDLDYPMDKFRVIVSDDGHDADLKAALAPLGKAFGNLLYYAPPKHGGFKAGNINNALRMLESADGLEPNPWICILDADMIPEREMFRVLIAPALKDPGVGLVAIPQNFYNIPVNDPLHQNMELQHQRDQAARNEHNAAFCSGSGVLFCREGWQKVGGFCETSTLEDLFFGWSLNGVGYKTAWVNMFAQTGLQPDSFQDHFKQRRRWFTGGIRNCKALNFGFSHPILNDMTLMQRIIAMNQLPKPYLMTMFKGLTALLNIIALIRGIMYSEPVVNPASDRFTRILYAFAFHKVAGLIFDGFLALGYGHNFRRREVVSVWAGMHLTKAAIHEELASWFDFTQVGFEASGARSGSLILKERDATTRPSTLIRLSVAHQTERVLWHLVYFLLVTGLTFANVYHIIWASRSWDVMWFWLIIGPFFPGMMFQDTFTHLSPVWYFIKPPTIPDRRSMMKLDERTGGYRPLEEYRGVRFTKAMWKWEILNIVSVLWAIFAFLKVNGTLDGLTHSPSLLDEAVTKEAIQVLRMLSSFVAMTAVTYFGNGIFQQFFNGRRAAPAVKVGNVQMRIDEDRDVQLLFRNTDDEA